MPTEVVFVFAEQMTGFYMKCNTGLKWLYSTFQEIFGNFRNTYLTVYTPMELNFVSRFWTVPFGIRFLHFSFFRISLFWYKRIDLKNVLAKLHCTKNTKNHTKNLYLNNKKLPRGCVIWIYLPFYFPPINREEC